jgi:hypothetical protein
LPSLAWVAVLALALVAAVTIARQYFFRQWVGSVKLLGAGVILAPSLVAVLAMNFGSAIERLAGSRASWNDWHAERAEGVALRFHSFYADPAKASDLLAERSLNSYLAASGVPRGEILVQGDRGVQTWRWPNGLVLQRDTTWINKWGGAPSTRLALGVADPKGDEETERYQKRLNEERASKQSVDFRERERATAELFRKGSGGVILPALVLPSSVARMKQTPPKYEATAQLRLVQPEPWIEVPFAPGGWHAHAAYGFRLGDPISRDMFEGRQSKFYDHALDNVPGTVAFPVVATMPDFLWDSIFAEQFWIRRRWEQPQLYVINRAGGDLIGQNIYRTPRISIAGVGVVRDTVRAWTPALRRGDTWVARDPQWLDGAKLVLVGVREEARFTREVKAERFMNPP